MNDCDFVLCHLLVRFGRQRFLLNKADLAWLPTDYGVLTRLGEDEVAKPATTVHIVSVDIASTKIRKVTKFCRTFRDFVKLWL